jgi:hydroxyquinol 1,2-dioxygenase
VSTTRNLSDAALTEAVLSSFDGSRTERFERVAKSLVEHLHAFVKDVELTEEEWFAAIDFLTRVGHITDERRQEFVLLSDVLGVSMLTIGINNRKPEGATQATVFGPFFVTDAPLVEQDGDVANGAPGAPCRMSGRVLGLDGEPVAGARLEVWQADEDGLYDVQYADLPEARGRGHLFSGPEGEYAFWTVLPAAYAIPADGPVGELLTAANRSPMRPAHVHFMITAPGYERLITHVFADGDPHLDSDAVFGVKSGLITPVERHAAGTAPGGRVLDETYYTLAYDFVLAPAL